MNALKIALAVVLSATSYAALADAAPKYVTDISQMEKNAWKLACEFKAVDCSQLPMPYIWYMEMKGTHGLYYWNAPGIEINVKLLGQEFSGLVMVHEMVHYIQWAQINASPLHGYRSNCARESEAFNITNAVAFALKISDERLRSWPEISRAYGCDFNRNPRNFY